MESAAAVAQHGSNVKAQAVSVFDRLSAKQMDRSTFGSIAAKIDPIRHASGGEPIARLLILWPDGTVWQKLSQNPKTGKALRHERHPEAWPRPEGARLHCTERFRWSHASPAGRRSRRDTGL